MPRTRRQLLDESCYHLIQRGNNRRAIFHRPKDFQAYFVLLKEGLDRSPGTLLHHYCLMPNRIHLLVRVGVAADLPRLMHWVNLSYTHHYRRAYDYVGHLFQGRYKVLPIRSDSHLLECARYIERNPLRAGLAAHPRDYAWSSYRFYAEGQANILLTASPNYADLAPTPEARRSRYQDNVLHPRPYEELLDLQLAGRPSSGTG